jgi:single-strand DNA-binding protein
MAGFNKVILMGNLTRDPELKHLPSGTTAATFGLASNRTYAAKDGHTKDEAMFIDVVAFGKLADIVTTHLAKGRQALIEGRLQYQTWEKDGVKRSKHEVVADRVVFLGQKPAGNDAHTG